MDSADLPVIDTQQLSKTYKGVQALKELNLHVGRNSIFAFLGPNGAGKTTAIKLLLGLARPTGGSGTVFGLDIARDNIAIRRRVGYLAQDPRYYETMTAREILRFTLRFFLKGSKQAIEERIEETIALVGLTGKADRSVRGFSGGERQRLGIAQAQIHYPDLLILDEPAASLDPQGRHDVLEVMERLRKHTTIFYSTHILSDVQRVSDTVAILNHGALVAQAPIDEILASGKSTVYNLAVKGETANLWAVLESQPWITSIQARPVNGHFIWQVAVSDPAAAETGLLHLAQSDPRCTVLEFGQKRADLEEIFLQLIEGGQNGRE
jgi:ABC-2 type transport system ATP-binding protein